MKNYLTFFTVFALTGCGDTIFRLEDHKDLIDSNTARIELLELNDAAQDLRLDALEQKDLDLAADIVEVAGDLAALTSQFNGFRFATNLRFLLLNLQLSFVINQIDSRLDDLENGLSVAQYDISELRDDVDDLRTELDQAKSNITDLQSQVDDVESRLTSVVHPCGEGNSEEVLLQTQDGLVAYFQKTQNKTINFSDTITVDAYTIPGHFEEVCDPTWTGRCFSFDQNFVGEHTIPAQTYSVGDSAKVKVLKHAYLDVLADGSYSTTDGFSCNFSIVNGEVQ